MNKPIRKVIISTNVIETGITIMGVSFVIDCLKHILVYYNPLNKTNAMRFMPVDKQMMMQRRGRVGRLRGGVYIALASKELCD